MASQRRMAVLPRWAGMFFRSVIIGGSGEQIKGRRIKQKGIQCILYCTPWLGQGTTTLGGEFIHNNA